MKKVCIYIIAIAFIAFFSILNSQGQDCCSGSIELRGKEFVEKDGNVSVKFSVLVKHQEIDPRVSIRLTPEISGLNNKQSLPSILINGKVRKRLSDRWLVLANDEDKRSYEIPEIEYTINKKEEDGVIDYEYSISYKEWMNPSNLTIRQEMLGCAEDVKLSNETLYSTLLIENREEYIPNLSFNYSSPEREKIKKRDFLGKAYIDFPVGSSIILADFRNNPSEIAKINADIKKIQDNSDLDLVSLEITGYASPEGSYPSNERLSQRRTDALKKYLETIFQFPSELLKTKSVAEDWIGFRESVVNNSMPYKEEILAIIDSSDAYDRKEQRIKALASGAPYKQILKDIFPALRRVEYQIDYIVKDYDLEETKLIYGKEVKNLSELELYNLAHSYTKGGKDYMYIMTELIPQNFKDSKTAYENAFAAFVENNELKKAKELLSKLSDEDAANLNNKGIYYLKTGDLKRAKILFKQAEKMGSQAAVNNLKEIERMIR